MRILPAYGKRTRLFDFYSLAFGLEATRALSCGVSRRCDQQRDVAYCWRHCCMGVKQDGTCDAGNGRFHLHKLAAGPSLRWRETVACDIHLLPSLELPLLLLPILYCPASAAGRLGCTFPLDVAYDDVRRVMFAGTYSPPLPLLPAPSLPPAILPGHALNGRPEGERCGWRLLLGVRERFHNWVGRASCRTASPVNMPAYSVPRCLLFCAGDGGGASNEQQRVSRAVAAAPAAPPLR